MRSSSTHPVTSLFLIIAMIGIAVPWNLYLGTLGFSEDQQEMIGGFIFTAVGLVLFRGGPDTRLPQPRSSLLLAAYIETGVALTMCCFGLAFLCTKIWGHVLVEVPIKYQWLGVKPRLSLSELRTVNGHGVAMFLMKALITAPLWEELLRGCLHGVARWLRMDRHVAIIMIAVYFALLHQGYVLTTLPVFLFLGWLTVHGLGWLERAAIHSCSNLILTISMLTANFGGSDLGTVRGQFVSLSIQASLFLILLILTTSAIKRLIKKGRVAQTT